MLSEYLENLGKKTVRPKHPRRNDINELYIALHGYGRDRGVVGELSFR